MSADPKLVPWRRGFYICRGCSLVVPPALQNSLENMPCDQGVSEAKTGGVAPESTRQRNRNAKHESNAERQRAYRERKRLERAPAYARLD